MIIDGESCDCYYYYICKSTSAHALNKSCTMWATPETTAQTANETFAKDWHGARGKGGLKFALMGSASCVWLHCNSDPRKMNNRRNALWDQRGGICCRQQTGSPGQQNWSTPILCHTSAPGAGRSVRALVPFPGQLGLLELWETANQGAEVVRQASCLCLASRLGQRSFLKAGRDFTIREERL